MYNKAVNVCSLGKQLVLFSLVKGNIETLGKAKLTVSLGTRHQVYNIWFKKEKYWNQKCCHSNITICIMWYIFFGTVLFQVSITLLQYLTRYYWLCVNTILTTYDVMMKWIYEVHFMTTAHYVCLERDHRISTNDRNHRHKNFRLAGIYIWYSQNSSQLWVHVSRQCSFHSASARTGAPWEN